MTTDKSFVLFLFFGFYLYRGEFDTKGRQKGRKGSWKQRNQRWSQVDRRRNRPLDSLCRFGRAHVFLLVKMRGSLEKVEFQTGHSGMECDTTHSWKRCPSCS